MLGNDIDLSAYGKGAAFNGGKGWIPIGIYAEPFKGSFGGDNKKIIGLYIDACELKVCEQTTDQATTFCGKLADTIIVRSKRAKAFSLLRLPPASLQ